MYEINTANVRSSTEMENPKFDLGPRKSNNNHPSVSISKEDIASVIKLKPPAKKTWEPDVKTMISTKKWLSTYGLKKNRLTMDQILATIGFKHSDDYDRALKKPVCSRYGEGLFTRYPTRNGKVYNVNVKVGKEKIKQLENSLLAAINLYKRRIEWLTSEARRLFGVIEDHCVTIVLDIKTTSPMLFDHCRNAIIRVLDEQVSQIAKFNLIRAAQDMVMFQPHAVPVSRDSLQNAMDWLRNLDSVAATTKTSACEGVRKAFEDKNIEAVYLFSEGTSANCNMELMLQKVRDAPIPINVVAFNNTDSTTIKFLKDVSRLTGGRFHAFAFNKLDSDVSGTSGFSMDNKILMGGVPPGAGAREDVVAMFTELEDARHVLSDVQVLLDNAMPDGKVDTARQSIQNGEVAETGERSEQYMSSKEWIYKHGLRSRKLDLYDALSVCAFKHCDGVVDVKRPPDDEYTDAASRNKLVNAKYCDKFCHVNWKDGSLKHVHVTADIHRNYERKMNVALQDFQRRVDWLQQGSRELFGTIIENEVYILIDTSNSMENHLGLVKEKLFKLMQEQLRHKSRFNLVKFGSRSTSWRDRMVEVTENSLQSAWQWVRNLTISGSTNTLAALKAALGDVNTQAVYLLTDGRPDHPPKTILAQVQLQKAIPIHTISFNCNDREANDFLAHLASDSGGRYHYYSDDLLGVSTESAGPQPYESEDVRLLKEEMKKGQDDIKKLADLRAQCALLDWGNSRSGDIGCGRDHGISKRPSSAAGLRSASQILSRDSVSPAPPRNTRPMSAHAFHTPSVRRPMSSLSMSSTTHERCKPRSRTSTYPPRPVSANSRKNKPNVTYHNKTSWLRLKGSLDGWVVPETRSMLQKQQQRFNMALNGMEKESQRTKSPKKKKIVDPKTLSSKRWLQKHGLKARKLTIYDALGKTAVKQRSKYVPILDKHVISQVFNDILPLAHVTDNRQEISLVNPTGIDLQSYDEKLQEAIQKYTRRLNRIVWEALTPEEQEQFDSHGPISFLDNRKDCLDVLDRLGWPISQKDIILLEDEIETGNRYLRHSHAIQRAVRQKISESGASTARSLGDEEPTPRKEYIKPSRRKVSYEETSERSKSERSEDEDDDSRRSEDGGESSGNEEEEDEEEELRNVREDTDEDGDDYSSDHEIIKPKVVVKGGSSTKAKQKHKSPTRTTSSKIGQQFKVRLAVRSKVIARSSVNGLFYPGTVVKTTDARHVEIRFSSDNSKEVIPSRFVIETQGARPSPLLRTGDFVLVCCVAAGHEVWMPGILQFGPKDESRQAKYYTVITYDHRTMNVPRKGLLKIANARYNFMVRYIWSLRKSARVPSAVWLVSGKNEDTEQVIEDLEDDSSLQLSLLQRAPSCEQEAQTCVPDTVSTEVQADDTAPEDLGEKLSSLQEQIAHHHDEHLKTQQGLREELKESFHQQKLLDEHQNELLKKHDDLLTKHTELQREHDEVSRKHGKLQKKHAKLKGKHGQLKDDHGTLESQRKELDERLHDVSSKHGTLESEFDTLKVKQDDLEKQLEEKMRQEELGKLQDQTEVDGTVQDGDSVENEDAQDIEEDVVEREEEIVSEEADDDDKLDNDEGSLKEDEEEIEEDEVNLGRRIDIGDEVIAQSPEDGWFYRGTVESKSEDSEYYVADSNNTLQKVSNKYILTDKDDGNRAIKAGNNVIALHPSQPYRYGPATVSKNLQDLWCQVEFYDEEVADIPREEMYFITPECHAEVKEAILVGEDRWVGHAAVTRNDNDGVYYLATIKSRISQGRYFVVEWPDDRVSQQHCKHIFGAFSRRQRFALGDHVLAMASVAKMTYLPGKISGVDSNRLVVEFSDGTSSNDVDPVQCFWLSEVYYESSRLYHIQKNPELAPVQPQMLQPVPPRSRPTSGSSSGSRSSLGSKVKKRSSSPSASVSSRASSKVKSVFSDDDGW
ncbi:von Willebrand factor A domain-containing protein 3B-like isoform X2 [Asterias rubens]|uniref:von Willebrand factor A domain-containing protein 3B-like isoform X2 n=1 Tax=Asterias rubens TaxID=7604 RepID=UPI00145557CC|nr:von Willebrand factor A domain-containing protein 3B-like isoform X2 [Asterias rubens]